MAGYFKPLRRKIGILTLVFACAFMAAWIVSLSGPDWPREMSPSLEIELLQAGIALNVRYARDVVGFNGLTLNGVSVTVPYWLAAIPLTLLSAWLLLLSKPRAKLKPTTTPASENAR